MMDGDWVDGDKVRYRKGEPQVIGGYYQSEFFDIEDGVTQILKLTRIVPDFTLSGADIEINGDLQIKKEDVT